MVSNYIDFSNYTSNEVLSMLREKQKEYIILIQSEKIAKKLLSFYGKELYLGNYHSRINSEYYLIYERAVKKKLITANNVNNVSIDIPIYSIICRLEDSKNELLNTNPEEYQNYKLIIDEITGIIDEVFTDTSIVYRDGFLYFMKDNEEILINNNSLSDFLNSDNKSLKKIKH